MLPTTPATLAIIIEITAVMASTPATTRSVAVITTIATVITQTAILTTPYTYFKIAVRAPPTTGANLISSGAVGASFVTSATIYP